MRFKATPEVRGDKIAVVGVKGLCAGYESTAHGWFTFYLVVSGTELMMRDVGVYNESSEILIDGERFTDAGQKLAGGMLFVFEHEMPVLE